MSGEAIGFLLGAVASANLTRQIPEATIAEHDEGDAHDGADHEQVVEVPILILNDETVDLLVEVRLDNENEPADRHH